jgi:NAD(P)-dependent dehydrogenase (short-subunit alcohol dehydrogenase family)
MRNIVVAGATGKQGQALIRALLDPTEPSPEQDWHIIALTRRASSPAAKRLAEANPSNLTIVEGDLENRDSIVKIFEDVKKDGGIWGVFCVLAFPGMGVEASGEELQGKVCFLCLGFCYLYFLETEVAPMLMTRVEPGGSIPRVRGADFRIFERDANGS